MERNLYFCRMKQAGRDMRLKGIYNEKEILYNEFVPYRGETEYPADVRESDCFLVFEKQKEGFL